MLWSCIHRTSGIIALVAGTGRKSAVAASDSSSVANITMLGDAAKIIACKAGRTVLLQNFLLLSQAALQHLLQLQAHLDICHPKKEGTIYNSPHNAIFVSVQSGLVTHKNIIKTKAWSWFILTSFKMQYRDLVPYLSCKWHFDRDGDNFRKQAAIKCYHESSRIIVREYKCYLKQRDMC